MRRVEIPVIGRDGGIAGVLCRNSPLTSASRSTPLTQDQHTVIIGEATRAILHDITNLLATIDCGLRLLERQTEVEGRQLIVDRMRRSVQRGAISSCKLLGGNWINKMDTRTLRPGGTLSQQRRICGTTSVLVGHFTPRLPKIFSDFAADQEDLYFALLALCSNASAALQHNGVVVIFAKNSVPRPGASTGVVEIIVADDGSGMTDEVLRRAFDSNFTTKPVGQGSGLGLGQVQQFVQESGGAIEIKFEVGVGTAVRMLLPVSRPTDGNSATCPI